MIYFGKCCGIREGSDNTQMNSKRPYKHILKNLFHEQAREIIPLLLPEYRVEQILDVEMPDLKSTSIEGPLGELEQGLVELALPEAKVLKVYKTEWIEHSGHFERAYRVKNTETDKPTYLLIEFQTEREDEELPRRLLRNFARLNLYASEDVRQEEDEVEVEDDEVENEDEQEEVEVEDEQKGTIMNIGYYVYPAVLCPFPQAVPAPIRDTLEERVML